MDARKGARAPRSAVRRNFGELFARFLCVLFALVGLVPVALALAVRTEAVKGRVSAKAEAILKEALGIDARFETDVRLIPFSVGVNHVVVESQDGGAPLLSARSLVVRPRVFSLLSGKLDLGDIELDSPAIRAVLENGKLKNLALPESEGGDSKLDRSPFSSLLVNDAKLDLEIDGTKVHLEGLDIDTFAEGLEFDVALRLSEADVETTKDDVAFHDKICALDLRAHANEKGLRIPRLSLLAGLAPRPEISGAPRCDASPDERIALRLSGFHLALEGGKFEQVSSRVFFVLPGRTFERLAPLPKTTGWIGFSGEASYRLGQKLPTVTGQLSGADLRIGAHGVSEKLNGKVLLANDEIVVPRLEAGWANGTALVENAKLAPFAKGGPLSVDKVTVSHMNFPGVMRDVAVTPNTIVDWDYDRVLIEKVRGGLSPFFLDGGVRAETSNFAVYDKAFHAPNKTRMVGAPPAKIDGRWRASPSALEFYDTVVDFGSSHVVAKLVSIGFGNAFGLEVSEGSVIELEDIGPLAGVSAKGKTKLVVSAKGPMNSPTIEAVTSIDDFVLGGFEAGNIEHADAVFEPLHVEFKNVRGEKGAMPYSIPRALLAFDGDASVDFQAQVASQRFDLAEFMRIFHFDDDPRFADLGAEGRVQGNVRYLLGGPRDECKSGRLMVEGDTLLGRVSAFGENFEAASSRFQLDWFDMTALSRGMELVVPSFRLTKGAGTVYGDVRVDSGGILDGRVILSRIPVSEFDTTKTLFHTTEGYVSGTAELDGTLERMALRSHLQVTAIETSGAKFGPSNLDLELVPADGKPPSSGESECGRPIPAPFDKARYDEDRSDGEFRISGNLFGGTINLRDVVLTAQRSRHLRGEVSLNRLPLAETLALVSRGATELGSLGEVSGRLTMEDVLVSQPTASKAKLELTDLRVQRDPLGLRLAGAPLVVSVGSGNVALEKNSLVLETKNGGKARISVGGQITSNGAIQAAIELEETPLGEFASTLDGVNQAEGKLTARLALDGSLRSPRFGGVARVEAGKLALRGLQAPLTNLNGAVKIDSEAIRLENVSAELGGGKVTLSGGAPLQGFTIGTAEILLAAREVTLAFGQDIRATVSSDLRFTVPEGGAEIPTLSGDVLIERAEYEKSMSMSADLADFTARGKKTEVSVYDPEKDKLKIDVVVRAMRPIGVKNNLVEADLALDEAGVHITGTDQRFGALGNVSIVPGGKVRLRRNVFDIKNGSVKFTDPSRIAPEVDVSALTEFRRSQDRSQNATTLQTISAGGAAAGYWRITMRAYGSPEDLHIDLKSDPPLGSDDIFLLLTVGMTRTELDQSRSAGVGSSVALEALGSLSGAENAVTDTVPIDEFRFGSLYSTKSGRSEPTVTIGKRLSERIRATVTSTMSDTSEVRSNVEYQATERLSLEGSYDNAQRAGAPAIGNLGGNIRWRLEFE